MKIYEAPFIEIIYLEEQDVMVASGSGNSDNIFGEELPDTPFN